MTLNQLQNLVKVKQLKPEPPDQVEFCNLVSSAKRQLQDARVEGLSVEGRFSFAYSAAHALSLAAMRWHLARNVRLLRVMRGWSQEVLALEAGLDRTYVGAAERGERNPTLASVERLAGAL
jgi:DNA-binding XRE family transcriptional regulator